jgi:hypothetical protein
MVYTGFMLSAAMKDGLDFLEKEHKDIFRIVKQLYYNALYVDGHLDYVESTQDLISKRMTLGVENEKSAMCHADFDIEKACLNDALVGALFVTGYVSKVTHYYQRRIGIMSYSHCAGYRGLATKWHKTPTVKEQGVTLDASLSTLMDAWRSILAVNGDLQEDYKMDYELLEHFIKVDKLMNRALLQKYRNPVLQGLDLGNPSDIFQFDTLKIDKGRLEETANGGLKYLRSGDKYEIKTLKSNAAFSYDGEEVAGMERNYGTDSELELYGYYTKVANNLVNYFVHVLNLCCQRNDLYVQIKLKSVGDENLSKVGMYVGEIEEGVPPKISLEFGKLIDNLYNTSEGFNKASMLTLIAVLLGVVSTEKVGITQLKSALFGEEVKKENA